MTWSVTTPPTDEPIALEEAKLYLRVDGSEEDLLIATLITAARQSIESSCERALMPQVWTERQATFPAAVELRGGLVDTVNSVKYVDADGVVQTLDSAAYKVSFNTSTPTVLPVGKWPAGTDIEVEYSLGYPDAMTVPAAIRAAMLIMVADMYAHREVSLVGLRITENSAVFRLLFPYKRVRP
jgi:uncharacterized phiE125 gp8 family phage protein